MSWSIDVKKIGKIPDGGGWKAHGREKGQAGAQKRARIGYDYVHSMVDDHSRLAVREVHGYDKHCVAYGYPKQRGLNIQLATLSTPLAAPVIARARLRSGHTASTKARAGCWPRPSAPPGPPACWAEVSGTPSVERGQPSQN